MMDETTDDVNRRKFMRRAAAAGAITLGISSTAGTTVARSTAAPQAQTESLLAAHGGDVLSLLEEDGVLADRSALPTSVENDFAGVAKGTEGAAKFTLSDGSEEFRVVKHVDAGTLTITVRPGDERAIAVLETEDGLVGYDAEKGKYDFGTLSHCTCTQILCTSYEHSYECCDDSHCEYFCGCQ